MRTGAISEGLAIQMLWRAEGAATLFAKSLIFCTAVPCCCLASQAAKTSQPSLQLAITVVALIAGVAAHVMARSIPRQRLWAAIAILVIGGLTLLASGAIIAIAVIACINTNYFPADPITCVLVVVPLGLLATSLHAVIRLSQAIRSMRLLYVLTTSSRGFEPTRPAPRPPADTPNPPSPYPGPDSLDT